MLLWSKRSEQTTGRTKPSPTEECSKQLRWECPCCSANIKLETSRLHSLAACDKPETIEILKFPPHPEVVWQQPSEPCTNQCNVNNTNNESTIYYTQETSKTTVASQTLPPKGNQPQNYVVSTEHPATAPTTVLPISKNQNSM